MPDNITINTGEITLIVNNDASRVIKFNPTDVNFVDRFFALIGEYEAKLVEFRSRAQQLGLDDEYIIDDIPQNIDARIQLLREFCDFTKAKIDQIFGAGTSKAAFGDAMNAEMFPQFFDGVSKYVTSVRKDKIDKYLAKRPTAAKTRANNKNKKK